MGKIAEAVEKIISRKLNNHWKGQIDDKVILNVPMNIDKTLARAIEKYLKENKERIWEELERT